MSMLPPFRLHGLLRCCMIRFHIIWLFVIQFLRKNRDTNAYMHIIISDVGLYDYADSLRTNFARPVVRLKTLCVYTYIAMTDWWALLITCAWWTIRHRCAVLMASVQITSGPSTYNAVALCGFVNCLHAVWCVRTAFVAVCTCLKRYTRLYFWFKVTG